MVDREKNLGLRVGDSIIHCNDTFTIVDIKREETTEGVKIAVYAMNPELADREQRKEIEQGLVSEDVMQFLKGFIEKHRGGE